MTLAEKRLNYVARAIWFAEWEEPFPEPGTIQHALALQMAVAATGALAEAMEMQDDAESSTPESGVYPEWHPIETAPRDGTFVDVWADGHRWANLYWAEPHSAWASRAWKMPRQRGAKPYQHNTIYVELEPTHWMPLPAAPAEARGDQPEGEA